MISVTRPYAKITNKPLTFITICLTLVCFAFISLTVVNSNITTEAGGLTYQRVIVQSGDTLWGLASKINNDIDTKTLVDKTISYNNLRSTFIQPGQEIYVPMRL